MITTVVTSLAQYRKILLLYSCPALFSQLNSDLDDVFLGRGLGPSRRNGVS
jgi:hypothetical protein